MRLIETSAAGDLSRREFFRRTALVAGGLGLTAGKFTGTESNTAGSGRLRAAVIGHTGRGDYGHDLDLIFNDRPEIEVVAVADPVATGREAAAKRCGARRQYAGYQELLDRERPQLVSIASRWSEQHHAIGLAALRAGAHLCLEKPISATLAEADDLLALAEERGLKIAVAHQMRLAPSIVHLKRKLSEGLIGELVQVRSWGKQDRRAGGEDMTVLGTHLFDLLRYLAGEPRWCAARILHEGREFTRADARPATEGIGPVGGTEIEAQFAFGNGVMASFTSRARLRETVGHWGMELIGSAGVVRVLMDLVPRVLRLDAGQWQPAGREDRWQPLPDDPTLGLTPEQRRYGPANGRVVDDWLEAIRTNREPVCSGRAAMKALEMVMAVYQAGLSGGRAVLPLAAREHPLAS